MSARHIPLRIDNETIADLMTIGGCVCLFTDRHELLSLDGRRFRTVDEARLVALRCLSGSSPPDESPKACRRSPSPLTGT